MYEQIQAMIDYTVNQIPRPILVTITKVYDDHNHVDCTPINSDETLTYIPTIANNLAVNHKGVLIFLENNNTIIITK